MSRAVLSLGSNLGDRIGHLRTAVESLRDVLVVVSGVYETPHWEPPGTPPGGPVPSYLNAVVLVARDGATPADWLARAHELERAAGRTRDPRNRFGPRTLDVDVIAVWADDDQPVISDDPDLTLPHPRAHLRAFVLRPWLDIQPYGQLPGRGWLLDLVRAQPVAADMADVRARPDLPLESDQ